MRALLYSFVLDLVLVFALFVLFRGLDLRGIRYQLDRFFMRGYRGTLLTGTSGINGTGFVIRKDTGERQDFWMRGDVSDEIVDDAMKRVATRLFGKSSFMRKWLGAVTHPTAVRNAIADLVVDRLDVSAPGRLVFQTSGGTAVATLTFGNPAFGSASSGTATANTITSDTNAAGGTVAKAELRDGASTATILCAVGTSGSDINLSSLAIGAGDTVSMSSLTYTAPN